MLAIAMRCVVHPDPVALEAELLDRIEAAQRSDPLARLLVIVPTRRLGKHLSRRIAERDGARLGIEVLTHRGLAFRLLEEARGGPLQVASRALLLALLERAIAALSPDELIGFLLRRPGASGSLLSSLKDLREAGIGPGPLGDEARTPLEKALARVYEAYTAELERLARSGFVDDAALVRAALPGAERFARSKAAIFHYGAYELIGVHLDLLRALDSARPVTAFLPIAPGAPATAYAETYARRFLLDDGADFERATEPPRGLLGSRLELLYDERQLRDPLPGDRVRFRHAQGNLGELQVAVRSALAAVSAGTPPHEIAIVARSLEPYRSAIASELEEAGLAFSCSAGAPLRREPVVRDLLLLFRAAAEGFSRRRTAELLRSPVLRLERLGVPGDLPRDLAEPWSRSAGITGGLEEWTRDLPAWASSTAPFEENDEERRQEREERARRRSDLASKIAEAVRVLWETCDPSSARSFSEHAGRIEKIARTVCPEDDPRAREALELFVEKVVVELGRFETVLGDSRPVSLAEVSSWLDRMAGEVEIPFGSEEEGGIELLDAMQARAHTFDCVLLLGMHRGSFPRAVREDPFLSDSLRERLREKTGRPIPISREAPLEERLLLALLLGSARERLEISWQRADETGKPRSPSLALRQVGRAVLGRPDLASVQERAEFVPTHPGEALETLAREPGLLRPEEGRLLEAFRAAAAGQDPSSLAANWPDLAAGLAMISATERFDPGDLGWDGRVRDALGPLGPVSVSGLERLGRCPLQFFLLDGLRIRPLEEDPDPFVLSPRKIGSAVHELLRDIYRALAEEGPFVPERLEHLRALGARLLEERFDRTVGPATGHLDRRAPEAWRAERERWIRALGRFLDEDLEHLASERPIAWEFEADRTGDLDFDGRPVLSLRARYDRLLETKEGLLIGDYKTSGDLDRRADTTRMLKGLELQVPLYWHLAGRRASVELLGAGPDFEVASGLKQKNRRVAFRGFGNKEIEEGFEETLRVLVGLLQRGIFPLHEDDHCRFCEVQAACRRNHPPTVHREQHARDSGDYREVLRKSGRLPTLAKLRGQAQEEDE
jgi:ATP-dependent helicase/nuclease subunit B